MKGGQNNTELPFVDRKTFGTIEIRAAQRLPPLYQSQDHTGHTDLSISPTMSSMDIAEEIRSTFPGTEELIVQYLSGYLVDDAGEEEDILQVARDMLESLAGDQQKTVDELMNRIGDLLKDQLTAREKNKAGPKLTKLDKVMDMSKAGAMSSTIALGEGVDLESINKGK